MFLFTKVISSTRLSTLSISGIAFASVLLSPINAPVFADDSKTEAAEATREVVLETEAQKFGYAFGVQLGRQFRQADVEFDFDMFMCGFMDVVEEKEQAMTDEELTGVMRMLTQKNRERIMAQQQAAIGENLKKADAFLAENKAKEGVVTTESGLQYTVLEAGNGAGAKPTAASTVRVHYVGTLLDGTEFDSSVRRNQPAEFPLSGVIAGWTEGLQKMPVGSKYRFWIHPSLGYGTRGQGQIPANSLLVFDVELLEIK